MAGKGGYRPGSGRKKGGGGLAHQEARELLSLNSSPIVNKALKLALDIKYPNIMILSKLLDKVLPTLTLGSLEVDAKIKGGLKSIPDAQLKEMIKEFSKRPVDKINVKEKMDLKL